MNAALRARFTALALALALVLAGLPATAQDDVGLLQDRAPEERPQLLVVGSIHFSNPGADVFNVEVEDVLSETRQAEIEDVVRQLAALQPTHVAVEWPAHLQDALDARYDAFRNGDHALERGEREQIGFRLAAAAGLDRVHAVDWNGASPGDAEHYDWPAYGNAHGQEARVAALFDPARAPPMPTLEGRTVARMLLDLNTPEQLAALHRIYFDIASIGDEEAQPGAAWVGHWYARNLRIFNRLVALAPDPADRVVAIYGAGHAHLLNQFAEESGAFEQLRVADVLTAAD